METTEKIVEAYVRYIRKWFTIPNIKCSGQLEIDLLAIHNNAGNRIERFHIESGVSISGNFSKLTNHSFSESLLKKRVQQAVQRRTLGYFQEKKFSSPGVIERLQEYGFHPGNYEKIIVTWGWQDGVPEAAEAAGIKLWDFREIVRKVSQQARSGRTYFTDDTMRTLQLAAMSLREA